MLVNSTTDIQLGGVVWQVRGGVKTRHVLESECWHSFWVDDTAKQSDLPILDISDIAQWCAHFATPRGHDQWGVWGIDERGEYIDTQLNIQGVLELKSEVIEASRLPDQLMSDLQEFWNVQFAGGCECFICKGRISRQEASDHVIDSCQMPDGLEQYVYHIASMYGGLENINLMDEPYWVYQIHRAHTLAHNKALEEQEEEQENVNTAHEKLRQHGIGEIH